MLLTSSNSVHHHQTFSNVAFKRLSNNVGRKFGPCKHHARSYSAIHNTLVHLYSQEFTFLKHFAIFIPSRHRTEFLQKNIRQLNVEFIVNKVADNKLYITIRVENAFVFLWSARRSEHVSTFAI